MFDISAPLQPMGVLWFGFLLGLRHAADADHVVAIGAIAARTTRLRPVAQLGLMWGLGHTLTLATVAGGIAVFNLAIPRRVALSMELCVAIVLMIVGAVNVGRHEHGDRHDTRGRFRATLKGSACTAQSAFLMGLLHGLAGSAAIALIVAGTVGNPRWVFGYLLVFGVGTLIGMTFITTGFAVPIVAAARQWQGGGRLIRVVSGVASFATGLWLAYQVGWIDGLFVTLGL